MDRRNILILNGSPRKNGTSYSFARTIKNLAEEPGNAAEIIHIIEYLEEGKDFGSLKSIISQSDIIGIVSPLYVDSLPYPVIWFFERLSSELKGELQGKSFFAIGQSAFPYSELIGTLLGSCKCFAEETQMKWLGGLGYGGGVMINGQFLESQGKKGKKITSAFKFALEDVLQNRVISPKAQELLANSFPKILARPMGALLNHMARANAKRHGVTAANIARKAYLE